MPAEIDTKWLIDHMDKQFRSADEKRSEGLRVVHEKIDDHAKEARETHQEFALQVTCEITSLGMKIDGHGQRFASMDKAAERKDGWWKTAVTVILGGGGLATLIEWLRGRA